MSGLSINFEDLLAKYSKHKNDKGSSELQIIGLTQRINDISANHIPHHHKDYPVARSLVKWVAQRRRHQRYLTRIYKHDADKMQRYRNLLQDLGLRR